MGQFLPTQSIQHKSPLFVSLGMIVLDELHFSSRPALYDVPGGSGLYATLGARLMDPAVGAILLAGHDFPDSLMERIMKWDMQLLVKRLPNDPCTRGFVQYKDDKASQRTFRYLTPQLQPRPVDLQSSDLLGSESFHLLANPALLEEMVVSLLSLRNGKGQSRRPLIVWEPAPLSCKKDFLDQHVQACKVVDIFSPNHAELGALVQQGEPSQPPTFSRETVERGARYFLDAGIGLQSRGLMVVRCGEHGCLTLSHKTGVNWLPPFYDSTSPCIADTTGAGNSFLGAFTIGWLRTGDVTEAAIFGSVASSFAIEQTGLPVFSSATSTSDEAWNGAQVSTRLAEYRRKLPNLKDETGFGSRVTM